MTSMSLAEYQQQFPTKVQEKASKSKYNNRKTIVDGISFDSKKEAKRYTELKLMQRAGLITGLQWQVKFLLAESVSFEAEKRRKRAMKYIADFIYIEDGQQVVEDVKSKATRKLATYRIKKHLMKIVHQIEIREV
jgi:hypothetical protein